MYGTRLLRRVVNTLRANWTAAERAAAENGWELTRGRHGSVVVRDPRIRAAAINRGRQLAVTSSGRWVA